MKGTATKHSGPDHTFRLLVRLIRQWVLPGTLVITDCWRAYNILRDYGLDHITVNHSKNIMDPETEAHTNNVEINWRDVRASIPKYGIRNKHYIGYLAGYMFKMKYLAELYLHAFLRTAANL